MKIAVLATDDLKKEIQAKITDTETELVYVPAISDFLKLSAVDAYFDLQFEMEPKRIALLAELLPAPVFINSVVYTLTEIAEPLIRINAWPGFLKRPIAELAASTEAGEITAKKIFTALNWPCHLVADLPGMVSARVIAMIINEAYYTFQENTSSKEEIDIAMKLGTNYPYGPFEWSKRIGLKNVYALLLALSKTDKRYTIPEALKNEANEQLS